MATPIYVDPAKADDTGNGTTPALAKKTIAAAISAVDAGGEVLLLAGTYTSATQGATFRVSIFANKSLTIKPNTGVTGITLTTDNTSNGLLFHTCDAGKTVRVEGLAFVFTTATVGISISNAFLGRAELVDCTFTMAGTSITIANVATISREVMFDGCTVTSSLEDNLCTVDSCVSFEFKDGTITSTGSTAAKALFLLSQTITTCRIAGNSFTSIHEIVRTNSNAVWKSLTIEGNSISKGYKADTFTFRIHQAATPGSVTIYDNIISVGAGALTCGTIGVGNNVTPPEAYEVFAGPIAIVGNQMTRATEDAAGFALFLGYGVTNAYVAYNDVTKWDIGCAIYGDDVTCDANYINGRQGIEVYGSSGTRLVHNHVIAHDDPDGAVTEGRCVVWNKRLDATASTTTYTATTVTDGGGSPWGGDQAAITAGKIIKVGPAEHEMTHYGTVVSITGDEVTVDKWTKYNAAGDIETPTNGVKAECVEWPRDCVSTDNVFDATTSTNCMTFDFDPYDPRLLQDRNLYHPGLSTMTNLGYQLGAHANSLAGLQTRWAAFSDTRPLNDANSQEISYATQRYINNTRWWKMPGWTSRVAGRRRPLLLP